MAKVIISQPGLPHREQHLQSMNHIGRHPAQTIHINDKVVSKAHAIISVAEGNYWVQDNNSRNGTFVNENRIFTKTELNEGDVVRLGETTLTFFSEAPKLSAANNAVVRNSIFIQEDSELNSLNTFHAQIDAHDVNLDFRPEKDVTDESILREDYEKLRAVYELSESVGQASDLDSLLERILDKIFKLINVSRAVILFDNDGELYPVAARGVSAENGQMNISKTILQQVQEKHIAIRSHNALMDSRFEEAHSIILQGIVSIICVPLIFDGEFLGVIYLDTQQNAGAFNEKDLKMITAFAFQASSKITNIKLAKKAEEEAVARTQLSRLLSPNLVEEVVKGRAEVNLGGKLMDATVMFADIRGFTRLSEKLPPEMLMSTLNQYFEIMVEVIFKYDGTLDKFIGDEIMAIWGAPIPLEDHGLRAIRAANEIRARLEVFNEQREAAGETALQIGIGINSGQMVAGYSGASQTLSYTVLGDAVNVASRLCSHAKPKEVLISDALHGPATNEFDIEVREPVTFKGKSRPLGVYQIVKKLNDSDQLPFLSGAPFETPLPQGMEDLGSLSKKDS